MEYSEPNRNTPASSPNGFAQSSQNRLKALRQVSLQTKVMGLLLITMTAILAANGVYDYLDTRKSMTAQLQDKADHAANRLAQTLATPFWDMNADVAKEVILSEMTDKPVAAIAALSKDGKTVFAAMGRDAAWKPAVAPEIPAPEDSIVVEREVLHKDKPIGKVQVFVTRSFMHQQLLHGLTVIIVQALLTDLVIMAVLYVVLRRYILSPLCVLENFAAIVAKGDLKHRPSGGLFTGELLRLRSSVESMVESLAGTLREVRHKQQEAEELSLAAQQAANEADQARHDAEKARRQGLSHAASTLEDIVARVTTSSGELASRVEGVSEGARLQADQVRETATAMEEMNATVLEVATNANQTSATAGNARVRAEEGYQIVMETVSVIQKVDAHSSTLKERIRGLGTCASDVGQIISVINDIADQTNLLALNAAIEAARAGDAGRGFAVVADEVRKLAEKTMQATKQVSESILAIQNGTQESVRITDETVAVVQDANELAGKSGQALAQILELVGNTTGQIAAIAATAEQQSATSEIINRRIEEINRITQATSEGMETSAASVGELAALSSKIKELVDDLNQDGAV